MNRLLALLTIALVSEVLSFAPQCNIASRAASVPNGLFSTESAEATNVDDALIPTKLPSDVGMDYVPLATMLASGQYEEADQVSSILMSKSFQLLFDGCIFSYYCDSKHL